MVVFNPLKHVQCFSQVSSKRHTVHGQVTMVLPDNVGAMLNIPCLKCLFNQTPGIIVQLFHVSGTVCTRWDTKSLGPMPDLTNHNCFTSRTAEGASCSEFHFQTHSSKRFGPGLVGYSRERGEARLLKKKLKIWRVGKRKWIKCNMTVLCHRHRAHNHRVTVARRVAAQTQRHTTINRTFLQLAERWKSVQVKISRNLPF